ncbi:hypothetical protein Francci3_0935 [Frankia casuarinae]|uniref:YkuD domain-containing protein n=1 Tax=Frankia casuarinae (strain DSM 45818 / CECT 9043 / HFP020203 / CcI3) TaxID=106370 RepID=Q2JEH3_FRACC|nr:hypothetical protein Francci3_0935 [Frankia casuarinae]
MGAASALHLSSPASDPDSSHDLSVSVPSGPRGAARLGRTSGLGPTSEARPSGVGGPVRTSRVAGTGADGRAGPASDLTAIPGVGPVMMTKIPQAARQVIVVSGIDRNANTNNVTLWERADPGSAWKTYGAPLIGRNGADGWTYDHREGDLRSPIGVFSLTAAGGKLADPGTGLPYEYRPSFYRATGPRGEPMPDAFNYVVAIDYNRLPGYPPSDPTRPLGPQIGGDIWLHVDHRSPTRGCIAVEQDALVAILRWLTPMAHPMIVMGDVADLGADNVRP